MTLLIWFLFGALTGASAIILVTLHLGRRAIERRIGELNNKGVRIESVTSRLKKVREITSEQMDLQGQISGPQKNALHGKHKNGLITKLKDLENVKTEILKSIIADGFDPEISVMDETGVVTTIKLSEFLAQNGITMPAKEDSKPPATKQVGKFIVHRGGKEEPKPTP